MGDADTGSINYQNQNIWRILLNIIVIAFDYIYDFIFNWDDDEEYENEQFIENEKEKHPVAKANQKDFEAVVDEYELLEDAFGKRAANYIFRVRQEVDYLVEEHNLVHENTILVVIPPDRIKTRNLPPEVLEGTIERIYTQYNKDVILKPGAVKIMGSGTGTLFAEMEIESYAINDELLEVL